MTGIVSELNIVLQALELERPAPHTFVGRSPVTGRNRIYGGLVVAQALKAAMLTVVPERQPHSLHGLFMRPGDPRVPISYDVAVDRDGGSFSSRRVEASQRGEPIFVMFASFQTFEVGLDHQVAMPDVPPPEALASEAELLAAYRDAMPASMQAYFARRKTIELRPVRPEQYIAPEPLLPPRQQVWMRSSGLLPDDPNLHACLFAYASDMTILDTALIAHGLNLFDPALILASVDHAVWFHRPFRVDDWLLYDQDSPASAGGRGFSRGSVFDRGGRLVASVAQEGMMRTRRSA